MRYLPILALLSASLYAQGGLSPQASAAWTSATAQNTTIQIPVAGFNCVAVGFTPTGTISAGVASFLGSTDGGVTYPYALTGYQTSSSASTNNIGLTVSANAWQVPVTAFTNFQLKLSNAITNTGTANLTIQAGNGGCHIDNITATISGNVTAYLSNEPCQNPSNTRTRFTINQTGNARIITGTTAKKTYICSFNVVTATTQNIALLEGTQVSTACDTSPLGMAGGATAATGWNFAANGGLTHGMGIGTVFNTSVNADDVCLFQSGAGQVSGGGEYVQQ